MRVFISWSGSRGRDLADALHKWIPAVLQAAKPYFSPDDISKGSRWASEIGKTLEESRVGLICVTRDSVHAPWIAFEAGALSKSLESSMVIPILFDLDTTEVTGPLVQFQSARFSRDEIKRVVETINKNLSEGRLDPAVLDEVFEMWWPKLEAAVSKILKNSDEPSEVRSDRDMLEEILSMTRAMSKSQIRSSSGRLEMLPKVVVTDLLSGLTALTNAAFATFEPKAFAEGLETLGKPIDYLARRSASVLPAEEFEALQAALLDAREKFNKEVREAEDLPF